MALRPLLLTCLLTALAVSGCAGTPGQSPAADSTADGADAGPGDRQAPLQGDAQAGGPGDAGVDGGEAAPGLGSRTFAFDGMTALGGCAYAVVVGQCLFPVSENAYFLRTDGTATRLAGGMTWEPQAGYTLRLYLLVQDAEGAWIVPSGYGAAHDTDGSLEFDWDVARLDQDDFVLAANAFTWTAAVAGGAGASVPFQFHLEGTAQFLADS